METASQIIAIPGDELILDGELARRWNVTTRTLARYEKEPNGLPYWMIGGKKYRAVKGSSEWLASRIRRPNPRRAA